MDWSLVDTLVAYRDLCHGQSEFVPLLDRCVAHLDVAEAGSSVRAPSWGAGQALQSALRTLRSGPSSELRCQASLGNGFPCSGPRGWVCTQSSSAGGLSSARLCSAPVAKSLVELRLVLFDSVSVLEGFHGKLPQRAPGSHCTAAAACARGSPGKFLRELQEFVT